MIRIIYLPPTGRLKNGEFIQLIRNLITVFEQNDAAALQLDKTLAELTNLYATMPKAHKGRTKNILTADMQEWDKKRIQSLRGLKKTLEILLLSEDVAVVRAAEILLEDLSSQFDNLTKMSMPNKTASINAMIERWNETSDLVEARGKVTIDSWLTKIQECNKKFDDLYIDRVNSTNRSANLYDKRLEVLPVYQKLMQETEARAFLAPDDERYTKLISKINILGKSFSNLAKSRSIEKDSEITPTDNPAQDNS